MIMCNVICPKSVPLMVVDFRSFFISLSLSFVLKLTFIVVNGRLYSTFGTFVFHNFICRLVSIAFDLQR